MAPSPLQHQGQGELANIELALIALLFETASLPWEPQVFEEKGIGDMTWVSHDPATHLDWKPQLGAPWLFNWAGDSSQLFSGDVRLLLSPLPSLLSPSFEYALITTAGDCVLRRNFIQAVPRLPAPFVTSVPHATYFLHFTSEVYADGHAIHGRSVHGWKGLKYVPVRTRYMNIHSMQRPVLPAFAEDKLRLVLAASFAEQASYSWRVRVESERAVNLATDGQGIKALAALRDDPRTKTGRLSPLLHWVQAHKRRKTRGLEYADVRKHLRGITEFDLGSVYVTIEEPTKPGPICEECHKHEYPIDDGVCVYCWRRIVGPEYR